MCRSPAQAVALAILGIATTLGPAVLSATAAQAEEIVVATYEGVINPVAAEHLHDALASAHGRLGPGRNLETRYSRRVGYLHAIDRQGHHRLALAETGDVARALAQRNPEVSPHLSFLDLGGHGYGLVTATTYGLETEFVAIPRPLERSERPDGGPIAYRVVHRTRMWAPGEAPRLEQEVLEGGPPLAT